ncbi:hypothetical protein KGM_215371 [Danaus plexippus plexippus]|uniref:Uncharacterized protein n=1 Tax=Danaus plexippus plexippus TaxID=278856 RepID=A0A212FLN0_DANPL|nr:hypothetical protein KGM_215371 [Danaus plexippus plexippus]
MRVETAGIETGEISDKDTFHQLRVPHQKLGSQSSVEAQHALGSIPPVRLESAGAMIAAIANMNVAIMNYISRNNEVKTNYLEITSLESSVILLRRRKRSDDGAVEIITGQKFSVVLVADHPPWARLSRKSSSPPHRASFCAGVIGHSACSRVKPRGRMSVTRGELDGIGSDKSMSFVLFLRSCPYLYRVEYHTTYAAFPTFHSIQKTCKTINALKVSRVTISRVFNDRVAGVSSVHRYVWPISHLWSSVGPPPPSSDLHPPSSVPGTPSSVTLPQRYSSFTAAGTASGPATFARYSGRVLFAHFEQPASECCKSWSALGKIKVPGTIKASYFVLTLFLRAGLIGSRFVRGVLSAPALVWNGKRINYYETSKANSQVSRVKHSAAPRRCPLSRLVSALYSDTNKLSNCLRRLEKLDVIQYECENSRTLERVGESGKECRRPALVRVIHTSRMRVANSTGDAALGMWLPERGLPTKYHKYELAVMIWHSS